MSMSTTLRALILGVLPLAFLPIQGQTMNDEINKMESAEKRYNEEVRKEQVPFMSLKTMFPDPEVRALAKAAAGGILRKIDELVKQGVSVNARGTQGATPLFWATRNYKGFTRLLELGADPNIVYGDGSSVMRWVVTAKDNRLLKTALKHGGNPNLGAGTSEGPLLQSALSMGTGVIDTLLDAGADIDARNGGGESALVVGAGLLQFDVVHHLLERGANYKLSGYSGRSLALIIAYKKDILSPSSVQAKWMAKVIDWLKGKGVEIPPDPFEKRRTGLW